MKIKIDGMSCNHCKMAVEKSLAKINGVQSFTVDLEKGEATVTGSPDPKEVIDAINKSGYQAMLIKD
ncbi:MAG: heavy-metal-associated domain-containing protein [bacterium]|nr:heavy-metal-associated domain-containing protein [bacterium]